MQDYLTTKEAAELLRIKERKLYELCAEGVLPVTRVTGKLLFPHAALMAWLEHNTEYGEDLPTLKAHPPVVAGSHDPLLEWALRASGSELAVYFDGSANGLERLKDGDAVAAGIHFHGRGDANPNVETVARGMTFQPIVVIGWARRSQGLVFRPDRHEEFQSLHGLKGKRAVFRQAGAGSQLLFAQLLDEAGLDDGKDITVIEEVARSENDVAQAVSSGDADAGLAVEAAARQFNLGFLPLAKEMFDLAIWRRDYFEPPLQRLLAFCRTDAFAKHAADLGGYDITENGCVRYNGA